MAKFFGQSVAIPGLNVRKIAPFVLFISGGIFMLTIPKVQWQALFYMLIILIPFIVLSIWLDRKIDMEDLGWTFTNPQDKYWGLKVVTIGAVVGFLLMFLAVKTHKIFLPGALIVFGAQSPLGSIGYSLNYMINTIVVAPGEETFFRGFIYRVLGGGIPAGTVQGLIFSGMHYIAYGTVSIAAFAVAFVFGFALAMALPKLGLLGVTVLHASWNNGVIAVMLGLSTALLLYGLLVPIAVYGMLAIYFIVKGEQ